MRPSLLAVLLLAATALVGGAAGDVSSNWGDMAKRRAYQHLLRRRTPPAPLVNANTLEADVARTRERVKCRDSDVILVSYPKVSWNHNRRSLTIPHSRLAVMVRARARSHPKKTVVARHPCVCFRPAHNSPTLPPPNVVFVLRRPLFFCTRVGRTGWPACSPRSTHRGGRPTVTRR